MTAFRCRSLRLDILLAFGGLLLLSLGALIFFYQVHTTRILHDFADDLMDQVSQRVIQETTSFMRPATTIATLSARFLESGILPLAQSPRVEKYALELLQSFPRFTAVNLADARGNFLMVKRLPDGLLATKIIRRLPAPPRVTWTYRDTHLKILRTQTTPWDGYDPRSRPWYQGALTASQAYWTDVYVFFTDQRPGITASYPVRNPNGAVLGVVGLDLDLLALSDFLKSLAVSKNGLAFIFNEKQELVAYPDPALLLDANASYRLHLRPVAALGLDRLTQAMAIFTRTQSLKFTFSAEGQTFLAAFTPFPPSFAQPWHIALVIPEDDIIGGIKQANRLALAIGVGILGLATLLALFLARSISKPILRLAADTEHIRHFKLDPSPPLPSNIREIQILSRAMDRMRLSLRSFSRFAPPEIVRQVVVAGQETMLGGERCEVTLLFSDLRNFTRFSEKTAPETVVQLLNDHFDAMVDIISAHDGFVVDFVGDCLFAVFGAPHPNPGHARQALRCALTMQLTRHRLNQEQAGGPCPPLEMGIGLNTGVCVVGNMGAAQRIKYGVVGHAVNLAARLETFTVGGQVVISQATLAALQGDVITVGPFPAQGKGLDAPIQIWEVRGLKDEPTLTLPPTVPGLTPLPTPLPIILRHIMGKEVSSHTHPGTLRQLSLTGAEVATDLPLAIFAGLHLEIPLPSGSPARLDARVVSLGSTPHSYVVKFSGLEPPEAAGLQQLLPSS